MNSETAVQVVNLTKKFGEHAAVNEVSFTIKRGEIFALLGPNGAGKTTIIKMLTTLLKPTSGTVRLCGYDVQKEPDRVRALFGLTGQTAAVDEALSARENLLFFARLLGLSTQAARTRTVELLQEFSLEAVADQPLETYSGGMRRRLDLAISLITRPAIIFLDEPTTGLDPRTRQQMWETIRKLVAAGATIILTTQYLEEADALAQQVAIIDHGKLVSLGTPAALKRKVNKRKLLLTVANPTQANAARRLVKAVLKEPVQRTGKQIMASLSDVNDVATVLNQLKNEGIIIANLEIKQASLDDVFFAMTAGKTSKEGK
ncbi:ABC-type multidrug transport system, ATPase component [Fructilactobacillus florum 8D]|uniref:ABC-type multidrug transport system, ATPase component n=1 Tax=Fructilactobacillus florum 8D TaxID=1221538 RepID=W9EF59_9LACO|nr:ATP-binding cassette domain-containing protein [Fructilactobacillus florum]EKK21122.1 ABC-type multidrug transport system, ATPase component [Fructilactobacillus florum 2F]ETO40712.1 ABC-type multidrug transport system, ATPase component [Fructilactobacillus florum 8D]